MTGSKCPTVPKTFLNEHSCKLLPGCLPLGQPGSPTIGMSQAEFLWDEPTSFRLYCRYSSFFVYWYLYRGLALPCLRHLHYHHRFWTTPQGLSVSLTLENLEKFFTVGGRYVYVVSGLRTTSSPCGKAQTGICRDIFEILCRRQLMPEPRVRHGVS